MGRVDSVLRTSISSSLRVSSHSLSLFWVGSSRVVEHLYSLFYHRSVRHSWFKTKEKIGVPPLPFTHSIHSSYSFPSPLGPRWRGKLWDPLPVTSSRPDRVKAPEISRSVFLLRVCSLPLVVWTFLRWYHPTLLGSYPGPSPQRPYSQTVYDSTDFDSPRLVSDLDIHTPTVVRVPVTGPVPTGT